MIEKLRNLDNKFVDKNIPYVTISAVNGYISPKFDQEAIAKKCEEKGKTINCKWTGLSYKEILELWEQKANVSRTYGKKLDAYTECRLEGDENTIEEFMLDNDVDADERMKAHIKAFDQFYERIMKSGDVEFVGREIEVWNRIIINDNDFYVRGRLDALFYNKRTDTWIIIDWKSNECISTKGNKWTPTLLGPAQTLPNLDWYTYTMQVFNYKEALLQNYLPEGTEASHVQCMIVNLPKAEYENADAALGKNKGEIYKAYMPAFKYDENFLNRVFEFAYKKDKLERSMRKLKEKEESETKIEKQEEFDLF